MFYVIIEFWSCGDLWDCEYTGIGYETYEEAEEELEIARLEHNCYIAWIEEKENEQACRRIDHE